MAAIAMLFAGCSKEKFEYEESVYVFPGTPTTSSDCRIVFVQDKNIYKLHPTSDIITQITTGNDVKGPIAISSDRNHIAYINTVGNVIIIDSTGNQIGTLDETPQFTGLGFYDDTNILYAINKENIAFYGSSTMGSLYYPMPFGTTQVTYGIYINPENNTAYISFQGGGLSSGLKLIILTTEPDFSTQDVYHPYLSMKTCGDENTVLILQEIIGEREIHKYYSNFTYYDEVMENVTEDLVDFAVSRDSRYCLIATESSNGVSFIKYPYEDSFGSFDFSNGQSIHTIPGTNPVWLDMK